MKTLYLECNMGAAGDMLFAALLELHPQPEDFLKRMNALGLPDVEIKAEPAVKCGITGTHVAVSVHGTEEESHDHHHGEKHSHAHTHSHDNEAHSHEAAHVHEDNHSHGEHSHDDPHAHTYTHEGHHHHSGMHEIGHIVEALAIPEQVKRDVMAVYGLIAAAESKAHGKPVSQVHFHEVGAMDAVADITGVCMLLQELAPDRICATPVHVGSGHVHCAHGILPVPAPATAHILRGVPTYGGEIQGELCTPTGAALLKYFVSAFGPMPLMAAEKVGYGMGKKEFPMANCVRAILGAVSGEAGTDQVAELSANLDDMTGEALAYAMDRLLEAGALDVFQTPIYMKKGRPGYMLTCLCRPGEEQKLAAVFFRHTTTIGVRQAVRKRYVLAREQETRETAFGPVTFKRSEGYTVSKEKPEFEDLSKIALAKNLSLREVMEKL